MAACPWPLCARAVVAVPVADGSLYLRNLDDRSPGKRWLNGRGGRSDDRERQIAPTEIEDRMEREIFMINPPSGFT
jgi:hypothetical protein